MAIVFIYGLNLNIVIKLIMENILLKYLQEGAKEYVSRYDN